VRRISQKFLAGVGLSTRNVRFRRYIAEDFLYSGFYPITLVMFSLWIACFHCGCQAAKIRYKMLKLAVREELYLNVTDK